MFDSLHHQLNNPAGIPAGAALALALATWPRGVRPKAHLSSQRTEAHAFYRACGYKDSSVRFVKQLGAAPWDIVPLTTPAENDKFVLVRLRARR